MLVVQQFKALLKYYSCNIRKTVVYTLQYNWFKGALDNEWVCSQGLFIFFLGVKAHVSQYFGTHFPIYFSRFQKIF